MVSTAERPTARGRDRALTALTLAVLAFAVAAFAYAQLRKQEPPPIAGIRFDERVVPACDCPLERASLSFTLRQAQPLDAVMVNEAGEPVRTLLDGTPRDNGRLTLSWDGTDDAGRIVPAGDYRLRLELSEPDRTIVVPADVQVVRE